MLKNLIRLYMWAVLIGNVGAELEKKIRMYRRKGMSTLNEIRVAKVLAEKSLARRFSDPKLVAAKKEEYQVTLEVAEANARLGEPIADILEYFRSEAK